MRTSFVRVAALVTVMFGMAAARLTAQSVVPAKAGLISYTEGQAYIDGEAVEISATHFSEIHENAVVRTEAGRAEVLLGPCAVMWIGEKSSFRMGGTRLADTHVELLTGSAVVAVGAIGHENKLSLMMNAGGVLVGRKGVYRFDMDPSRVRVWTGRVAVQWAEREILVGTGRMLALDGEAEVRKFDLRNVDSLDDWSKGRAASLAKASGLSGHQERTARELAAAAEEAAGDGAPSRPRRPFDGPTNSRPVHRSPVPIASDPAVSAGLGCAVAAW
jgi:hypothetical protein